MLLTGQALLDSWTMMERQGWDAWLDRAIVWVKNSKMGCASKDRILEWLCIEKWKIEKPYDN